MRIHPMRIKRKATVIVPAMTPQEVNRLRVKVLKMSQHTFAEALGYTVATVSRWENGKAPVRKHVAVAIEALVESVK